MSFTPDNCEWLLWMGCWQDDWQINSTRSSIDLYSCEFTFMVALITILWRILGFCRNWSTRFTDIFQGKQDSNWASRSWIGHCSDVSLMYFIRYLMPEQVPSAGVYPTNQHRWSFLIHQIRHQGAYRALIDCGIYFVILRSMYPILVPPLHIALCR